MKVVVNCIEGGGCFESSVEIDVTLSLVPQLRFKIPAYARYDFYYGIRRLRAHDTATSLGIPLNIVPHFTAKMPTEANREMGTVYRRNISHGHDGSSPVGEAF